MRDVTTLRLLTGALALTAMIGPAPIHAQEEKNAEKPRQAIERGLTFLIEDARKWRQERQCSTCHHGTMTVWALNEAKARGYKVAAPDLAEMTKWAKERLKDIDKPRDPRPGWSMVNSPAHMLATMAQALPSQESLADDELRQIAGHLLRHQEADGSWAWSSAPAKNRPPPFFESDEVATLLGYMALGPFVPVDASAASAERDARARAAAWLAQQKPSDTTQAAAYRLLSKVRAGGSPTGFEAELAEMLRRQNPDGGWGQLKDRPSDAYATGQALYIVSLAGVGTDRAEVRRAVDFLTATQQKDGSWPMTRRGHPGVTPGPNAVPIIYFGSAWATLGLMHQAAAVEGASPPLQDSRKKDAIPPAPRSRVEFARAMANVTKGMTEQEVTALLGKPDDIKTHTDPGGISTSRTREIWRYGTDGHLTFPTLGSVYIDNERKAQYVFGGQGKPPDPELLPEEELCALLRLLDRAPSYQFGYSYNPLLIIRIVNALQPLGKEKALAAIEEYLRVASRWHQSGTRRDVPGAARAV